MSTPRTSGAPHTGKSGYGGEMNSHDKFVPGRRVPRPLTTETAPRKAGVK
jgi:hypothetical protein